MDENKNNELNTNYNYQIYKHKDLLQRLLKEKLDTKLSILEKRSKLHISILSDSSKTVKNLTSITMKINKQIQEKFNKEKQLKKDKSQKKIINLPKRFTISPTRPNFSRAKTPLRQKMPFKISYDNRSETSKTSKKLTKNKTSIFNNSKNNSRQKSINKRYETDSNNINTYENTSLRRPSIVSSKSIKSIKSNKTNLTIPTKNSSKKKINSKSKEKFNRTPSRKKTPLRKIMENKRQLEKEDELNNKKIIDMFKMESNLQKADLLLIDDDPLLVAPVTDFDFSSVDIDKKKSNNNNKDIFGDGDIIDKVCDYLEINDILNLKNLNKKYKRKINIYFIKKLEKEKIFFINKKLKLNIDENSLPPKLDIKDLILTKGAQKAIDLLNENLLNKLFTNEKIINQDILIIYRIFFQLIGHPYKNIPKDNNILFWEKCRYYFINETDGGKTGDLIKKIFKENKIDIGGNNLYQLYKLVYKDLNKIAPQYFSKICGTTGLFVFIIKDVLDFVGISNVDKCHEKVYWTYVNIIESINKKINYIKDNL